MIVFCFYCHMAENCDIGSSATVRNKYADKAFIIAGFPNWKKALKSFNKHQYPLHIVIVWISYRLAVKLRVLVNCYKKGMLRNRP